jgi:HD-GYP domain-containing protein (c-di-GMP phosphodiesterase class II)
VGDEPTSRADQYRHLFSAVVASFAASHELSDPFTAGHQQRVARLAGAIGERMGLGAEECEGLAVGATLHDVGKVAVPVQLLIKPGRLNPAEFDLVKRHAQDGHDILARIEFPWPVAEVILQHHERIDGSGYPRGLIGDEILVESRIVAVADTVESVSSHRPYQLARPLQVALDLVASGRARLFDPDVVDACVAIFDDGFALDDRA